RHADVAGEVETLGAEHPLRESLTRLLMLALYRSGRQAEALRAYQEMRHRLVEDLGIEPGESLQLLQRAILQHDPALDLPAAARVGDRDGGHLDAGPPGSPVGVAASWVAVRDLLSAARARPRAVVGLGGG